MNIQIRIKRWWNSSRVTRWVVERIVCMKSAASCGRRGSGSMWMGTSARNCDREDGQG